MSIFAAILAGGSLVGLGWPVVSYLDKNRILSILERITASFLVGGYFIYFGVFTVGIFRLDQTSMSILAAFYLAGSLPGIIAIPWRSLGSSATRLAKNDPVALCVLALGVTVSLTSLIQGLAPPNDYDSLLYHLTIPMYDIEIGKITFPSDSRGAQALFPAMMSNLSRILLTLTSPSSVQMAHGLYGIIAAGCGALIALRLNFSARVAATAFLFFVTIRAVVWQMATAETDVPLAAYFSGALLVYLAWREVSSKGLSILFGLLIGAAILTKYIGFALALSIGTLVIIDLIRKRSESISIFIGPLIALIALLPHMVRNLYLSGNPLFPIFNRVFNPDEIEPYAFAASMLGTGRGIFDFLLAPWTISVQPMQFYDGMVLGAPYLFAFAPLICLCRRDLIRWGPSLLVSITFFFFWFWTLSQQVRFLIPILPIISAVAAAGFWILWSRVASKIFFRSLLAIIITIIALNQAMFVGVYALVRLPVAFGLVNEEQYLADTPTMQGSYHKTCSYIQSNLQPGELYYSNLPFSSFYCPQTSVILKNFYDTVPWRRFDEKVHSLSRGEFIAKLKLRNIRFFILQTSQGVRRDAAKGYARQDNASAKEHKVELKDLKLGTSRHLKDAVLQITPLVSDKFSAVYDGFEVLKFLETDLRSQ